MKIKESEKKKDEEEIEDEEEEERKKRNPKRSRVAETDNVGDPSVEINVEELIKRARGRRRHSPCGKSKLRNGGSKSSWRENERSAISRISTITMSDAARTANESRAIA